MELFASVAQERFSAHARRCQRHTRQSTRSHRHSQTLPRTLHWHPSCKVHSPMDRARPLLVLRLDLWFCLSSSFVFRLPPSLPVGDWNSVANWSNARAGFCFRRPSSSRPLTRPRWAIGPDRCKVSLSFPFPSDCVSMLDNATSTR